jgi:hypothetical protein
MDTPFLHEVKAVKVVDIKSPEAVDALLTRYLAYLRDTLYVPRGSSLIFVMDEGASSEEETAEKESLRQIVRSLAQRANVHGVILYRPNLAMLEPSRAQLSEVLRRSGVEEPDDVASGLLDRYYCVPRGQIDDEQNEW